MPLVHTPTVRALLRVRANVTRCLPALLLAGAARAEPLFDAPFHAFNVGAPVNFAKAADLNIDGRQDLVTCGQNSGTVRVQLGTADGTFAAPLVYGISQGSSPPVIADLTGDGILDITIADFPNTSVGILPGNGDGTFGDTLKVVTGFQCYTVVAADLNGDSALDLVVANWVDVGVLLGMGDGTFGAMSTYPTPTNAYRLAVGELNGDNHPDVVSSSDYSQIAVLFGVGNGALQPAVGLVAASAIFEIDVVDATGDGVADVVAGLESALAIFPSSGDGSFQARVDVAPGAARGRFAVGDINGDGHPDAVTTSGNPYITNNHVAMVLGDGLGGFPIQRQVKTIYNPADVVLADFNGDGNADLLTAGLEGLAALHYGNGDGNFGAVRRYSTGSDPIAVGLDDLDGDSKPDLIVAHRTSASFSVRRGVGDGTFGVRRDYDVNVIMPAALALGDLDGDGRADIAVADAPLSSPGAGVSVFTGYSNGEFAATHKYFAGPQPAGVAIGDFNGDGARDLVVTDWVANRASVLLNQGNGSFNTAVHYGAGAGATGVAIGDLNGDLHLDVATANRQAGSVTVLLGSGDGSFSTETELVTAPDCRAVAIGLLNEDAIPDLVTANGASATLSVMIGQGGGLFAPATTIPTGRVSTSVAIAQLDGDALADLVVGTGPTVNPFGGGSLPSNVIAVMVATGGGAFRPPLMFGVEDNPEAVAVADLDGEGGPDIAVTNRLSEFVSVLMHNSSPVVVDPPREPVELGLGHGYPNPSLVSVRLEYTLRRPAQATLRVHDATGRLVRVLADGMTPAGRHIAVWDRRTDRGARAAAGVYFCDLRVGALRMTRRIVLL